MTSETTFCRFCIAACGLEVQLDGEQVVSVGGVADHPLSRGYTCEKGRHLAAVEHHPRRLSNALVASLPTTPRHAVDDLAAQLNEVLARGGPDSIATYQGNAAGFDTTAWAACGWFGRALGTTSRFTSLTLDAVAKPYVADLMTGMATLVPHANDEPALVLIVGANPVVSHGHTAAMADPVRRLRAWKRSGAIWVVDPRRTETAELANRHVACRPGTDHIFLAAVLRHAARSRRLVPDGGRGWPRQARCLRGIGRRFGGGRSVRRRSIVGDRAC